MKRTQVLAVIATFIISTVAFSQKINSDKVPATVKQAFNKAYPTAKATKWDKEGNDFEASFEQGKEELSVVFDGKGNVLEVEKEIAFSALPAPVQAALKGKKVKETAMITKAGKTFYEAEVGGKDLMFDAQGKASN